MRYLGQNHVDARSSDYYWAKGPRIHRAAALAGSASAAQLLEAVRDSRRTRKWRRRAVRYNHRNRMKRIVLLSLVLFVVACFLPALENRSDDGRTTIQLGWRLLAFGGIGLLWDRHLFTALIPWFANLLWAAGFGARFTGHRKLSAGLGLSAFAFGASAPLLTLDRYLPADPGALGEASYFTVAKLLPGYFVWLASLAMLPTSAYLNRKSGV